MSSNLTNGDMSPDKHYTNVSLEIQNRIISSERQDMSPEKKRGNETSPYKQNLCALNKMSAFMI